ncbi:MAG: ATP-binding cassette domain-containing protein [Bacteroidales bacterium]|jgi:ABC-2 type transport system ATP-binding protein|nr:ATP-binding cassette domain-containing protein [Bacteroidales bacterium]
MALFSVKDVSKTYSNYKALDRVSIEVEKGEVFGLLGPNGAGKTTLIRIINQITAPDEGEIFFMGEKLRAEHVQMIGYLPEERGLYKKMKVGDQAIYLAELKGLKKAEAKKRLEFWFEKFEISSWWDKKVEELSKGMQQKVQFITTILHEPKLLIFDEPFSGFDPINANLLKQEILSLKEKGATIIFSTHNMESVEEICDSIALINKSKKILDGKVTEIKQRFNENLYEIIIPSSFNIEEIKMEGVEIRAITPKQLTQELVLKIDNEQKADFISRIISKTNLISYRELLPSMNQIFINAVSKQ